MRRYAYAALAGMLLTSVSAQAQPYFQQGDFSKVLTTTPVQAIPQFSPDQPTGTIVSGAGSGRIYQRIVNVGVSGSAWCSRANQTPAPNTAGSYEIPPGGSEEFNRGSDAGYVPRVATWCVAASGTVPITVEA